MENSYSAGLSFCITKKLPGAADAADPQTTPWVVRAYRLCVIWSLVISAFPLPLPLHLLCSSHSDLATPQISQVESHFKVSILAVPSDWNPPSLPNTSPSSDRLCNFLPCYTLHPHQNVNSMKAGILVLL